MEAALARTTGESHEAFLAELRRAYPRATVSQGTSLGTLVPGNARLYVYRDPGEPTSKLPPGWWFDEALPLTVLDAEGRYIDANERAAELFGVSRDVILGAMAGSFTRHEQSADVRDRLLASLRETGELCSTAVVVLPNGLERPIDYHTRRRLDGAFETVMRPGPDFPG